MPAMASAWVKRSPAQVVDGTTLVGTGEVVEVDAPAIVEVVVDEEVVVGATVEEVVDDVVEDVVVDDVVGTVPAAAIRI